MSKLRRFWQRGEPVFITMVTHDRKPILANNASTFRSAIESCRAETTFELPAWVLLPDHLHMILEPGEHDLSTLIQRIKMSFAARYRKANQMRSGRLWQHRFWDHIIRDQIDYNRHIDYIHYNPVKHGLVKRAFEWEYSSIQNFRSKGLYPDDWGPDPKTFDESSFGE